MDPGQTDVLVAEIGSTTTVMNAFGGLGTDSPLLLAQGMAPTSVDQGDVRLGLREARSALGTWAESAPLMASSSAAGGLVMTVHGLVYDMTARAAREAALGAGAIVRLVTAGLLDEWDQKDIARVNPGIILLAGGVDHGEKATVVANARALSPVDPKIPVIYGGNAGACREVVSILKAQSRRVEVVDNVYPSIDRLHVEPARKVIHKVFEERISDAPGMEGIREEIAGSLLPTPGAVMKAARLLYEDIGDLMVVDVGGATTDIHSVTRGSEKYGRISTFPEPLMKRTVEGDLGVFRNASYIVDLVGYDNLVEALGEGSIERLRSLKVIPFSAEEKRLIASLARESVNVAVSRHAGRLKDMYGPLGRVTVVEGRDLTNVRWLVGTGGPLTRLPGGEEALRGVIGPGVGRELFPREAEVCIDRDYVMASCGVLGDTYPREAVQILRNSLGI